MGERKERIYAIDALRGIVMVLMALDHVRDFWNGTGDPTNLATTTPALFLTRWITHFCAPVFVLLAGTSAWLYGSKGRTRGQLARFLVTRGLWLIVLEFTVVNFAWMPSRSAPPILFFQVIAAIGFAMIALAGLIYLPGWARVALGLALVAGHNLLDPIEPGDLGGGGALWRFLHEGSLDGEYAPVQVGAYSVLVIYPLLPWIGLMVLGYALGPWTARGRPERRRVFGEVGLALVAAFAALRWLDRYGDPSPWSEQGSSVMTVLSFLNCTKYPPSLDFLLMTLGPALVALALLDREPRALGRALIAFGRVPLFFYVAHLFLGHLSARLFNLALHGESYSPMVGAFLGYRPEWFSGCPLWGVYAVWLAVVLALYPACAAFARLKRRSSSALLSYL